MYMNAWTVPTKMWPNAFQSCFCWDSNASSRILTCGVGGFSRPSKKTAKLCKEKRWPNLMVFPLHDWWKVNGPQKIHKKWRWTTGMTNKCPKQWHQKTRLPKTDKRKGRMFGNQLNASQSCFCSDCNSSSRVLTCGVGNYSRNVWCLRVAVGKNKICSKTKNHWPDQMVSSLHDYWKLL